METTLEYIKKRFSLDSLSETPIFLENTRTDLANIFRELNFKIGAEVGVFNGNFSKILCEANPDLKLFCIDTWEIYEDLPELKNEKYRKSYINKIPNNFDVAKKQLQGFNCEFIKKYSMDAVKDFQRNSLDFVYIDANHAFDYVMEDIIEWSKIIRVGGVIGGHDYRCFKNNEVGFHVSSAVNTFVNVHRIKPLVILDKDRSSSWFYVKTLSEDQYDW